MWNASSFHVSTYDLSLQVLTVRRLGRPALQMKTESTFALSRLQRKCHGVRGPERVVTVPLGEHPESSFIQRECV